MQKNYFLLVLVVISQISMAQTQIIFDYDAAGNRILRKSTVPLPVTLISFTAVRWPATNMPGDAEGSTALLNWQTASEIDSDRFEIERSQDGKKWINVGKVMASGDKKSSLWYSFTDKNPLDGENLYRLKMIDRATDCKDDTFSLSRIQSLSFPSQISFYPNPVKDLLKIKGNTTGRVQLINNTGKVVYNSDNIPTEGIEMVGFSAGIYLIRITQKDGSMTIRKIVKQ